MALDSWRAMLYNLLDLPLTTFITFLLQTKMMKHHNPWETINMNIEQECCRRVIGPPKFHY